MIAVEEGDNVRGVSQFVGSGESSGGGFPENFVAEQRRDPVTFGCCLQMILKPSRRGWPDPRTSRPYPTTAPLVPFGPASGKLR